MPDIEKPKLTLAQALIIRDDFKYIEGDEYESGGIEQTINRIIVGPYPGDKCSAFFKMYIQNNWDSRDDEEILAQSFETKDFSVYMLLHDIRSVYIHEHLLRTLSRLNIEFDGAKYGLKK